eukprot:GHVO01069463.1.p1 GENE.GHVO01069463.1~~GHVO01069463.1.p1  ORF type:complete len:293 (-),score=90.95 GHVO01069463.1:686-1564(-)
MTKTKQRSTRAHRPKMHGPRRTAESIVERSQIELKKITANTPKRKGKNGKEVQNIGNDRNFIKDIFGEDCGADERSQRILTDSITKPNSKKKKKKFDRPKIPTEGDAPAPHSSDKSHGPPEDRSSDAHAHADTVHMTPFGPFVSPKKGGAAKAVARKTQKHKKALADKKTKKDDKQKLAVQTRDELKPKRVVPKFGDIVHAPPTLSKAHVKKTPVLQRPIMKKSPPGREGAFNPQKGGGAKGPNLKKGVFTSDGGPSPRRSGGPSPCPNIIPPCPNIIPPCPNIIHPPCPNT